MADSITDAQVASLRAISKRITNPKARNTAKERHLGRDYDVSAGAGNQFSLFVRQSQLIPNSFSCGLLWHRDDGTRIILARYNGSDHPHYNPIEGDRFEGLFHIHLATERYMAAGRKTEHWAEATDRFSNVDGALKCLLLDWNITGLDVSEQEDLAL